MRLLCEDVLATVQWAHQVMYSEGHASGFAVDLGGTRSSRRSKNTPPTLAKRRLRGEVGKPPSKHARYLRGDTVPHDEWVYFQASTAHDESAYGIFYHPLFNILRDAQRYAELDARSAQDRPQLRGNSWLVDLAPRINCQVFEPDRRQAWLSVKELTSRQWYALATQGDGYALSALLAEVFNYMTYDDFDVDFRLGERAFQCMIFAFANGEFSRIQTALSVRIRQLLLDKVQCKGVVLDTASVDIHRAVAVVQHFMQKCDIDANTPANRKSAVFREFLKSTSPGIIEAITPPRVSIEVARAHRMERRKPIEMDSEPEGQLKLKRHFGKKARAILENALKEYWLSGDSPLMPENSEKPRTSD